MYLLDTDVVSALRRPERNAVVSAWVRNQTSDRLYTSVITVGEILYGIARQRRRQPEFAAQLERWLESVTALFKDRVLVFDDAAARRWGVLHAELGFTSSDLQIAAIAWSRGLTVVTRNVRHFEPTGVSTLNPIE
jgi:predicted nucleic acid-binding protein